MNRVPGCHRFRALKSHLTHGTCGVVGFRFRLETGLGRPANETGLPCRPGHALPKPRRADAYQPLSPLRSKRTRQGELGSI